MVIRDSRSPTQLTLNLAPDLVEQYRTVRDVIAAGVYRRGLKRMAGELDVAPGNLSIMVSDDPVRHFDVGLLERYMEVTGDITPIHYLVARFCKDADVKKDAAIEKIRAMAEELPALMAQLGGMS